MGKAATIVFDHGKNMLGRAAGGLGSALKQFNEAKEQAFGHPGPRIEITPFAPGSVTTGAALFKLGSSLFAAARERANAQALAERQAGEAEYRTARVAEIKGRLAEPTYEYTTPGGATVKGLTGYQRVQAERESHTNDATSYATPADVAGAYKAAGMEPPPQMTVAEERAARYHWGLPAPGERAPSTKYDPRSESEISSEASAEKSLRAAREQALADYTGGRLIDPQGNPVPKPNNFEMMNPDQSEHVLNDPRVLAAANAYQMTRGRNIALAIGRANDFNSLVSALSLFSADDPLLPDAGRQPTPLQTQVASVAHAAGTKLRQMAQTEQQKALVRSLLGE